MSEENRIEILNPSALMADEKDFNGGEDNSSIASEDTEIGGFEAETTAKGFLARPSLRERIFLLLTEPSSSTSAYAASIYFDGLVAFSMVQMCAETVVSWSRTQSQQRMWRLLDTLITMNFLVELVGKVCTARPLSKYILKRPSFVIDCLGLLPFVLERIVESVLSTDEAASIKALRVLRLLRFFRLSRIAYENLPDFRMFIDAVKRSKLAIAFLGMYVFGAGLLFASCIYFAETSECSLDSKEGIWYYSDRSSRDEKDRCVVQSMFGAWWFTLVTMTTVGYGDVVLVTPWGRVLSVLIMISSLVFLALPSAIFGANLTEMYLDRRLAKKMGHAASPPGEKSRSFGGIVGDGGGLSGAVGEEVENLLASVEAAGQEVQTALSTLSTHLAFIQHQQQHLQFLLHDDKKKNK